MLFEDAVAEYMADKGRRLRATTMAGYESAVRCHLLPRWAGRELESIGLAELQAWVDGFVGIYNYGPSDETYAGGFGGVITYSRS